MMTFVHVFDIALWLFTAFSTVYVAIFAFLSLLPNKKRKEIQEEKTSTFLVLIPAYKEDTVIRKSVETFLQQDYPSTHYHLCVISDHMQADTNAWLQTQRLQLLTPDFEKSSKAQALAHAISQATRDYDYVVILDADNIVSSEFLSQLNKLCANAYQAIQCHRTAKNTNNDIAVLDSISEEINNSLFRKAHNSIGLSSALIGSGMCFAFQWFKTNVYQLSSAVEDRELEALLMRQNIFIKYAHDIDVLDEKVSNKDNFQRQRLRWMTGQVQSLFNMLPYIPTAIWKGNVNYIDKTIQQALIPRAILLVVIPFMALIILIINPAWSIKWWCQLALLCMSIIMAIPSRLRTVSNLCRFLFLPQLAWRMLLNLMHIDKSSNDFIHTTHNIEQ